jgi:hypothetical protein
VFVAESSVVEPVEIQFDQPRRLVYNLQALRALDRVMGEVGIVRVLELLRAANFQTLERALWAGLIHDEPTLTVSLVAKRLEKYVNNGGGTTALFTRAYDAINESRVFGRPENKEGNEQPEPETT